MAIFRSAVCDKLPVEEARPSSPLSTPVEDQVVSLFERHRASVFRYLLSCGVPSHDAEEILQEVFILLFRHLQRGRSSVNLVGWVFRAAHNFVLKHRHRTRRDARHFDPSGLGLADIADDSARADVALAEQQRQTSIMAVVKALPEMDQRCLSLRAEGLRYREIAEVLGISLGAVANSLERSIARIARANQR